MKHMKDILATFVALTLIAGVSYAETNFYVDGNLGTDDGAYGHAPGTNAWKTLNYAYLNYTAVPNESEIINVAPAVYEEYVAATAGGRRGEQECPLIWQGEDGVVLDATTGGQRGFLIYGYQKIHNFEIINATTHGIQLSGSDPAQVTITNCCIHNNGGSGVYVYGSGSINNCTIVDCESYSNGQYGAVLISVTGTNVISGNKVYGNTLKGIAISTRDQGETDTVTVRNNVIYDNSSYGLWHYQAYSEDILNIYNNTIYSNTTCAAAFGLSSGPLVGAVINFVNNITAQNGTGVDSIDARTITYCDVTDGTGANITEGTGCITYDPQFVDKANRDFRLNKTSPCINAGDPGTTASQAGTIDYWGNPRFAGIIDIGAYEVSLPQRTFITIY